MELSNHFLIKKYKIKLKVYIHINGQWTAFLKIYHNFEHEKLWITNCHVAVNCRTKSNEIIEIQLHQRILSSLK